MNINIIAKPRRERHPRCEKGPWYGKFRDCDQRIMNVKTKQENNTQIRRLVENEYAVLKNTAYPTVEEKHRRTEKKHTHKKTDKDPLPSSCLSDRPSCRLLSRHRHKIPSEVHPRLRILRTLHCLAAALYGNAISRFIQRVHCCEAAWAQMGREGRGRRLRSVLVAEVEPRRAALGDSVEQIEKHAY